MEEIDIIDKQGKVIGSSTKEEAHKGRLLHKIVGIILSNKNGKIILQKRAKSYSGGDTWDFSASGHVKKGEKETDAAIRELKEELGISCQIKEIGRDFCNFDETTNEPMHLLTVFIGKYDGEITINKEELAGIDFFENEEIRDMISNQNNIQGGFKVGFKLLERNLIK